METQEIANAYVQMYRTYVTQCEPPGARGDNHVEADIHAGHTLDTIVRKYWGVTFKTPEKLTLTQQDVANDLGIARTTVTAIEKGERRVRPDELSGCPDIWTGGDELTGP